MGTPHNEAEKGEVAKRVLMPGDPLRAKYIAEHFLKDAVCFNTVRNMLGYTGTYKGEKISVMEAVWEFHQSESILMNCTTNMKWKKLSASARQEPFRMMWIFGMWSLLQVPVQIRIMPHSIIFREHLHPIADYELLESAVNTVREKGLTVRAGNVLTSDVFYNDDPTVNDRWRKMGVLAVEMEAAALYMNAARAGKKALCMLTISDHLYKDEKLSARERQLGFDNMIQIALDM